jgi:sulfatase maturation enzyme AslB (radical SAM superfamily)
MEKNLNRFFKRPTIVAAELFSAGWCNLECKYCYIPKTNFLKKVHKNIIEKIEDGTYLTLVKEMIGPDLDSISHWGTEPSLTTKHFKNFYKNVKTDFPKFKIVKLSSNFMTPPNNLFEFVTDVLPNDYKLEVDIQVSCDGPPYITDKNRIGGSTSRILDNCLELTRKLNEANFIHTVSMHLKPTFSAEDISLCSNFEKTEEYYTFFDNFFIEWFKANSNNRIIMQTGVDPTIVLPGSYSVQDGKNFSKLYENQIKLKDKKFKYVMPDSNYYYRFKNKMQFYKEYFTKQRMFVCSAGDSCIGIGDIPGTVHPCHATFYLDHEEYTKEATEYGLDYEAQKALETGKTMQLRKGYVVENNDDLNLIKKLFSTRAYNDFTKLKISNGLSMVLECAKIGQVSSVYKDVELAKLLSFMIQTTECPIDSILITGSISVPNISLIRLFGNGFFERALKRIITEIKQCK